MSNYTYHGTTDLVTLPQRNVQTFPSGLVRVDRVYACRKTLADRFRQDLAAGNPLPLDPGTPAIDGLYIFPEPQEIRRDDGFVEFRVSAYGRTNTTGVEQISEEFTTESISSELLTGQAVLKNNLLTKEVVLLEGETILPTTDAISGTPTVVFDIGNVGQLIVNPLRRLYSVAIRSYTARNYGRFTEVTAVYGPFLLLRVN
jgi:hypothetical protein